MKTLVLSFMLLAFCQARLLAQGPENVLLVVNENSEESKAIARYYAEKRKIPPRNICRIRTGEEESIDRSTFERQILKPVAEYLKTNSLQDQILYIVTTRGLPLVVQGNDGPVGDMASVDSELTLIYRYLVFGVYQYYGRVENPYFASGGTQENFRPFVRANYDICLVTRLTASSLVDTMLMIDRGLNPESGGYFYFDLASAQKSTVSEWLADAAASLERSGQHVTLEKTGKALDELYQVLGYANQGSNDTALADRIPKLHWTRGAIATVFDKSTAHSLREPPGGRSAPDSTAARYIQGGATGFGGYVGDPTPDGLLRPQILFPAYAAGYNLAESFYAATRYISWHLVVIGDPLVNPFYGNLATQRNTLASALQPRRDPVTGLPEHYSKRRELYLLQKYNTSEEAAAFFLRAEASADSSDIPRALALLDQCLQLDPFIVEAHLLKAELLDSRSDFAGAYEHYKRALELSRAERDLYLTLARLAYEKLKDAQKAAPYTQWLYQSFGSTDMHIASLHAEVLRESGKIEQAKAVYLGMVADDRNAPFDALAALGRIYFEEGNVDLAKSFLTKAIEASRKEPDTAVKNANQCEDIVSLRSIDPCDVQQLLDEIEAGQAQADKDDVSVSIGAGSSHGVDGDVRPARILSRTPISYPEGARLSAVDGVVVVSLFVDEMGQLMKAELTNGNRLLGEAVLKAVRRWRFEPKLVRGKPEASRLPLTVNFVIKKTEK